MVSSDHLDVDERPLREAHEACREPLLPFEPAQLLMQQAPESYPACQGYPHLLSDSSRIEQRNQNPFKVLPLRSQIFPKSYL
jgi:hypothetical protein